MTLRPTGNELKMCLINTIKGQLIAVSAISALFGLVGCKGLINENKETCFCEITKSSLREPITWFYHASATPCLDTGVLLSSEYLDLTVGGEELIFIYSIMYIHGDEVNLDIDASTVSAYTGTWCEEANIVYLYADTGECFQLKRLDEKTLLRPKNVELGLNQAKFNLSSAIRILTSK